MKIYIRDQEKGKYYKANVGIRWVKDHDNGALISCGLNVGQDLDRRTLDNWLLMGAAKEVTELEWRHGGCQSECVIRRGKECRW